MTIKERYTRLNEESPRVWGLIEVLILVLMYGVISFTLLGLVDVSPYMEWLSELEAKTVSGFFVGACAQILAVTIIWFLFKPAELKKAVSAIKQPAEREGWHIAFTVVAIEIVVIYVFFLDIGWRGVELGLFNITGSLASAPDGITQEVFFRGYLMLRLSRAGFKTFGQIVVPVLAFAAMHFGYAGEGIIGLLAPMLGTLSLGAILGFAFIKSGYSLKPVIFAHVTILLIVQPWLAFFVE